MMALLKMPLFSHAEEDGRLPELSGQPMSFHYLTLLPSSYAFILFQEAQAQACMP